MRPGPPECPEVIRSPPTEVLPSWEKLLGAHIDERFKSFILLGLREGFRVGFQYRGVQQLKTAKHNLPSCIDHPEVFTNYIGKE